MQNSKENWQQLGDIMRVSGSSWLLLFSVWEWGLASWSQVGCHYSKYHISKWQFFKRKHSFFIRGLKKKKKNLCQKLPVELFLRYHWPEPDHMPTLKPNRRQNELVFPQITWSNSDSYPEAEHIASSFRGKKKREGMFLLSQKPQQCATTGRWEVSDAAWVGCEAINWRCWETGWLRCQMPSEKREPRICNWQSEVREQHRAYQTQAPTGARLGITTAGVPQADTGKGGPLPPA